MDLQPFVKTINKQINHDLKNLSNWLNANKMLSMSVKENLLNLVHLKKQLNHELKIKFNDKKLYWTDSFKISRNSLR